MTIVPEGSIIITGELKGGAKVTIEYSMTAKSVEVKPAAAASPQRQTGGGRCEPYEQSDL